MLCRECTSRAQQTIVEKIQKWQLNQAVIIAAAQHWDLLPFPLFFCKKVKENSLSVSFMSDYVHQQ